MRSAGGSHAVPPIGAALMLIAVLALGLRTLAPLADPPRWLTVSYAALIDGPWYTADAVARATGISQSADETADVPASYRKPLFTRFCELVYRATGATMATRALPAALAGTTLALIIAVLLTRAAGATTGAVAGLLVAGDALLVGWNRTAGPYSTVAVAVAFSVCLAAAGRTARRWWLGAGLFALAIALSVISAWGLKAVALCALAPIGLLVAQPRTASHGSRFRILPIIATAAASLTAIVVARADLADAVSRLRLYVGDVGMAELPRRLLHVPAAAGPSFTSPLVVALAIAAPVVLRATDDDARVAARVAAAVLFSGLLVLGLLPQPDMPYLALFWPAAIALAALVARAIALGGRPSLKRPWLASGCLVTVLTFLALDALISVVPSLDATLGPACMAETGLGSRIARNLTVFAGWFGDPYQLGPERFLRVLAVSLGAGCAASAFVAVLRLWRPGTSNVAPRPRLAAALILVHFSWQLALSGSIVIRPRYSLREARIDLQNMLDRGSIIGEQFAFTVADGERMRPHYSSVSSDSSLTAGSPPTHLAMAADRWSIVVRSRVAAASVASFYVSGIARVRIVRMPGVAGRSAFERGRDLLDRRDWPGARRAFEDAVRAASPDGAGLAHANLAVAETLGGDLQAAEGSVREAERIEPDTLAGHLAGALLSLRRAGFANADREVARAIQLFPDRNLLAFSCSLESALRARDADALTRLGGIRAELLVLDLLR